jgi:hypothetical protein
VSRERALRRAEREAQQQAAAAKRERALARRRRRPTVLEPRTHDRRGRPDSVLLRRRRRQNAGIALATIGALVVTFILVDSWALRIAAVLFAALAVPVLVTLLFDRRP